jgi:hypothetical protein
MRPFSGIRSMRSLRFILAGLAIVGPTAPPALKAAGTTRACDIALDSYRERGKLAEFNMVLRCDDRQKGAFAVNEPLLLGLTATTSDKRENDSMELEYDFPLQNIVISPGTTALQLTFHSQLADIFGKTHVYAMAWPLSFLQDCAGGRSGCRRFGYALDPPTSISPICTKKDEDGEIQETGDARCAAFLNRRFKFR